jgi:hypothetical protein
MAEALLALFTMPWPELSGLQRMSLLLPLTASVAIVYKTLKCQTPKEIPVASLILWITIVVGMYMVGIVLMILYRLLA